MPDVINKTTSEGLSLTMKTYYDKKMLEVAKTKFVFQQFGQKRPIPANEGKTVKFRRYNLFTPNTVTQRLEEAVTPTAQELSMTDVEATVAQYGAFVYIADLLNLTAIDPIIRDAAELLGEQMGTVVDWLTRDAMIEGASVQYAGGKVSEDALTVADSKMTVNESRKAVRSLKKAKARPFSDGTFVQIVDPDVEYDLMNDQLWKDLAVHADPKRMVNGEIGTLFGVKYVESTECKVDKQTILNKVGTNYTSGGTSLVLSEEITDADTIAWLKAGTNFVWCENECFKVTSIAADGVTLTVVGAQKETSAANHSANAVVFSKDAGAPDATTKAAPDVHHSLIFGADSYGVIDIAGSGAIKTIIKQIGSSGASDPLDQRGSVGCKVMAYVAKVLNSLWIIDILCCAS